MSDDRPYFTSDAPPARGRVRDDPVALGRVAVLLLGILVEIALAFAAYAVVEERERAATEAAQTARNARLVCRVLDVVAAEPVDLQACIAEELGALTPAPRPGRTAAAEPSAVPPSQPSPGG